MAIVTVNYERPQDTIELLRGLQRLKVNQSKVDIIVVDNGSGDDSVALIKKSFPGICLLTNDTNRGFAGGYNDGINHAQKRGAEYIMIINNDTLVEDKDLLNKLMGTIKSNPSIGAVSPKILFARGYEFHKSRYKKSDQGKVIWYAGGDFDWDNVMSLQRGLDKVDEGQYDLEEKTKLASACCALFRQEVFSTIKGFDEKLFAYFEDNDFFQRLIKAGYLMFYNGKTSIYHKVSQTSGIGSTTTDYYLTRNRLTFATRYCSWRTKLAVYRQALKLLLGGRPAQRAGVRDFLFKRYGKRRPA